MAGLASFGNTGLLTTPILGAVDSDDLPSAVFPPIANECGTRFDYASRPPRSGLDGYVAGDGRDVALIHLVIDWRVQETRCCSHRDGLCLRRLGVGQDAVPGLRPGYPDHR